jgi:hypothetical protein
MTKTVVEAVYVVISREPTYDDIDIEGNEAFPPTVLGVYIVYKDALKKYWNPGISLQHKIVEIIVTPFNSNEYFNETKEKRYIEDDDGTHKKKCSECGERSKYIYKFEDTKYPGTIFEKLCDVCLDYGYGMYDKEHVCNMCKRLPGDCKCICFKCDKIRIKCECDNCNCFSFKVIANTHCELCDDYDYYIYTLNNGKKYCKDCLE